MYVYYKNKLIAKARDEKEKDELIGIFTRERRTFYNQLYDRIETFLDNLSNIREKQKTETIEEYKKYLEENHKEVLLELDLIGKEFYRKRYKGFYFQNSIEGYIGYYVETKGAYDCIPLSVLLLKCAREMPINTDFNVIEK